MGFGFPDAGMQGIRRNNRGQGVRLIDNQGDTPGQGTSAPGLPVFFCRLGTSPHMHMHIDRCGQDKRAGTVNGSFCRGSRSAVSDQPAFNRDIGDATIRQLNILQQK
jgi:hypothetical protein